MKTTHTPGPWRVQETRAMITIASDTAGGAMFTLGVPTPQRRINAALIAAAPELLGALRSMIAQFDDVYRDPCDREAIDAARAAIAKADP